MPEATTSNKKQQKRQNFQLLVIHAHTDHKPDSQDTKYRTSVVIGPVDTSRILTTQANHMQ